MSPKLPCDRAFRALLAQRRGPRLRCTDHLRNTPNDAGIRILRLRGDRSSRLARVAIIVRARNVLSDERPARTVERRRSIPSSGDAHRDSGSADRILGATSRRVLDVRTPACGDPRRDVLGPSRGVHFSTRSIRRGVPPSFDGTGSCRRSCSRHHRRHRQLPNAAGVLSRKCYGAGTTVHTATCWFSMECPRLSAGQV